MIRKEEKLKDLMAEAANGLIASAQHAGKTH